MRKTRKNWRVTSAETVLLMSAANRSSDSCYPNASESGSGVRKRNGCDLDRGQGKITIVPIKHTFAFGTILIEL